MTAVLIILGLIAAVSVYDFLSSKNWQLVTSDERNETVFQYRNHNYGAYKIRKDYNLLIILIMLSVAGSIAASYGIYKALPQANDKKEMEKPMDLETFAGDESKEEEKELEPLEEKIPEEQKTLAFIPPVIVDHQTDDEVATDDELDNTDAGKNTQDGSVLGGGNDTPPPPPPPDPEPEPEPVILDIVDESAEYPGGRAAMMAFLQKNIKVPDVATELGLSGKVVLKFVVSSSGNISNVRVQKGMTDCEECDKEAQRVVKMMPNWSPGKVNGKPVNQWFTLPIKFDTQ